MNFILIVRCFLSFFLFFLSITILESVIDPRILVDNYQESSFVLNLYFEFNVDYSKTIFKRRDTYTTVILTLS